MKPEESNLFVKRLSRKHHLAITKEQRGTDKFKTTSGGKSFSLFQGMKRSKTHIRLILNFTIEV